MPSASAGRLRDELKGYGVAPGNVRLFGQTRPEPDLQDYLALDALRRDNGPAPDGVAEFQGRPVLYFVDEQRLTSNTSPPAGELYSEDVLPVIFRKLACRGERAYLARVEFGKIQVAPVSPTNKEPSWVEYTPGGLAGRCLLSRLAFGITEVEDFAAGDAVFDRLFKLLKHAANRIARNENLRPDALSLVGRALFFRFLRDRGVLDNYPFTKVAPGAKDWTDCFGNATNAFHTCAWLDATFNGDFLPLTGKGSKSFFQKIDAETGGEVFRHLSAVIKGHLPHGADYQPLFQWHWDAFDFAQIPVGLLSQVYEAFSWEWSPKDAKKTSQHYTPRNIAVTLIDEVFDKLPDAAKCKVLDPACGAGVFLVLAFRRLYRELWKTEKGKDRPGTAAIRRILERQLVGFDISENALKLAALSLYLTAIELDPEPKPPDKLIFKDLQGNVLFNVREPSAAENGAALGSLGIHLRKRFNKRFNVIVSNPPWTPLEKELGARVGKVYQTIIGGIEGTDGEKHELPDNNPDLPFLWKATQWCKPGGRIAMALPPRILFKNQEIPRRSCETLFRLIQVDGIINGTNLRETGVWPGMKMPWMLMFCTKKRPEQRHNTYFVTLSPDTSLNRTGLFRIDSESARPIDNGLANEKPWLWKALSIGTMLDVDVIEKIKMVHGKPLEKFWNESVGHYRHGKGYILGEPENRTRDATHLEGLPHLKSTDVFSFVVHPEELPDKFPYDKVQWPKRESIYEPPLVLVKEAPGEDRRDGRGLLCFEKIAYNGSFSGFSAAGHADGELLVRYLHLFIHSDICMYYILLTSPQFGAERRRFHKADLEDCVVPSFEDLTDAQRKEVARLSKDFEIGTAIPWEEIDAFFAKLYGLKDYDLQVIQDTLSIAMPYETARAKACMPPTEREKKAFATAVMRPLTPLVSSGGGKLIVERIKVPKLGNHVSSPFDLMVFTSNGKGLADPSVIADGVLEKILQIADETGATQIVIPESGRLVVGIYNQYRYWTLSRARLLAGEIIRFHLDAITG
jgi:hypothetical protein